MARVLTFVSIDLVGSSGTLAQLGEDRAEGVRRAYFALLRSSIRAGGGVEVATAPDGLIACFESPSNAVGCAIATQRAFARHNTLGGDRLDVRIGVQVGETLGNVDVPGREELGVAAIEATGLSDAALGGQILVSHVVEALARARCGCAFSPVGLLRLQGASEPVSAFEVLYERDVLRQLPLPPEVTVRKASRTLFVGRRREQEQLQRAWRLATEGERQLIFIAGEPGIGKTRLAAELAREVHVEGAAALWGRSFEEALVPYQPFVQALRHYVSNVEPDELGSRLPAADAALLARLLPELAVRTGKTTVPIEEEDEGERYRLFEAITSLFAQVAAEAPLLLVLDDLQWADRGTLLLLKSMALDPRPWPMLVLATYRDSEVTRAHPVAQLQADVLRDRGAELIELTGLTDVDAAALIDSLLAFALPASVARRLLRETEGNPFFLEEVVHQLMASELLSDPKRLGCPGVAIDELGVPRRVKELVGRRLQRLPPSVLEALSLASVVGSEFQLDVLARILDEPEDRLIALLDSAVEARVLVEAPDRIGDYGFAHALIQQALYEDQTANRRASLHTRVAEALEVLHPDALAPLAHHFSASGQRSFEKVVAYGRAAGEQALELLAYEDAAREFARALTALDGAAPDDANARAELLVLLGSAQSRAGEASAAAAAFAEAAEIATRIHAAPTLARAALGYGGGAGFGGVWTKFGLVDEQLMRFLEDALEAVGDEDSQLRVRLLGRLAEALYWAPDSRRMLALSEQALAVARQSRDPVALAHALDSRHVALWEPANLQELRHVAEEMLRLGKQLADRELQLEAYAWLITDTLESEPIGLVDHYIDAHARLAEELRQPYHLWYTEVTRAMRAHLDGRFDDATALIDKALEHGRLAHRETARQASLVQLMLLKLDTGQLAGMIEGLEQNAAHSPLSAWQAVLALAYAGVDRRDEALALVERFAADDFACVRRDCAWTTTLGMLARVIGRFEAAEYAPPLYRLLFPYADRNCVVGGAILCLGPISRLLGMLARMSGDYESALDHLRDAMFRSRALGSRSLVARTQLELAQTFLDRAAEGDDEHAYELLVTVEAAAAELGMTAFAQEARALRAGLSVALGAHP